MLCVSYGGSRCFDRLCREPRDYFLHKAISCQFTCTYVCANWAIVSDLDGSKHNFLSLTPIAEYGLISTPLCILCSGIDIRLLIKVIH